MGVRAVKQRDSRRHRFLRRFHLDFAPANKNSPGINRIDAEQGAAQLGATGAHQPCHPDNLPGTERKRDIVQFSVPVQAFDTQHLIAGR